MKKVTIEVQGFQVLIMENDFISLTDIAKRFDADEPAGLINNWMRLKDSIELLGAWESLYNERFNLVEFDKVRNSAGSNRFRISPSKLPIPYGSSAKAHTACAQKQARSGGGNCLG